MIFPIYAQVMGIRDTESVRNFKEKLEGAARVVIVGNGGIATELVHELKGVEVVSKMIIIIN